MIQIPALIVFASAIGALLLIGGLINAVYRLGVRVAALETWRNDLEQVNAARMRAKSRALKALE